MKHRKKRANANNSVIGKKKFRYLAAVVALVLMISAVAVTFAWYHSQVSLNGSTFSTGTLDYSATGYNENGELVTTLLSDDKDPTGHTLVNAPLFNKTNWSADVTDSAYIVIEKKGTLELEYKFTFSASGDMEYLGGFWYALTDVTSEVPAGDSISDRLQGYVAAGHAPRSESDGYSMATVDRYATVGTILDSDDGVRFYRLDYGMRESAISQEYTGKTVELIPSVFVTQVGALESDSSYGYTYNCSTQADIEKARDSSLPGDSIRLLNSITFEGDLVFNKAINILTNNYTLEVMGNLIYDYVAPKNVTVNVVGNGAIKVTSPGEGVGGNIILRTPSSDVTIIGGNSSEGDITVAGTFTANTTCAYGASGLTLERVRLIDSNTSTPATVYVESNTRVTVSGNTTVQRIEAVNRAGNIELVNSGTVGTVALSRMNLMSVTTSPQIYIVNMGYIIEPIELPSWSKKFVELSSDPLTCEGNTRIVQTVTGNSMTVSGTCVFTNADIEVENTGVLVAPINGSDAELVVYYQNIEENGEPVETSIQYLLEKYFNDRGISAADAIAVVRRLDIISIGDKAMNNDDINYLKSTALQSLSYLDLGRANVYDSSTDTAGKLCDNAFRNMSFTGLVLPQNLVEIGSGSLRNIDCTGVIQVPSSVTAFGSYWFYGNKYVAFASSTPAMGAYNASYGMTNVKAIFVEEYYVEDYKASYTSFDDNIFPMAQLDDSETHFVRQPVGSNDWEIVYYVGSGVSQLAIGDGLRVNGSIIKVTGVGAYAYKEAFANEQVSISFADSVEYIGERAFMSTAITEVTGWGQSLKTISPYAFYSCKQLEGEISLPQSMRDILDYAFYYCTGITGFNAGGTTFVGTSTFGECSALIYIDMPSVTTLEQTLAGSNYGMFYNDRRLVSVKLPSLVKSTGLIFNGNNSLKEIIFSDTVYDDVAVSGYTSFRNSFFGSPKVYFNMTDVSDVSITNLKAEQIYPTGEKYGTLMYGGYDIGEYIISDSIDPDGATIITSNLSFEGDVSIPDAWNSLPITYIGNYAFVNQSFTDVNLTFGDSLREIGSYAFNGKGGISSVAHWGSSLEVIGNNAFANCDSLGEISLPDSMVRIGNNAFNGCDALTFVNTGGTESMGSGVFTSCKNLVSAKLPQVLSIGDGVANNYAFRYCESLVSVEIPVLYDVKLKGIFSECDSLYEITMGSDVAEVSLGTSPFEGSSVSNLKLFVPVELLDSYKTSRPGGLAAERIYPIGEKLGEVLVNDFNIGEFIVSDTLNGDGTATIITTNVSSFTGTVQFPDNWNDTPITSIYDGAFRNSSFENATLSFSDSLENIGSYAFYTMKGIVAVSNWGTGLENIGAFAFNGTGLTGALVLPSDGSLTNISASAFQNCTSVTSVNTGSATNVGQQAFMGCKAMVSAVLPMVETVGAEDTASYNYLFNGCTSLVSVEFPMLTTVQGSRMFYYCTNIREIFMESPTPSLGSSPFYGWSTAVKNALRIYAPSELLAQYKSSNTSSSIGSVPNQIFPIGTKHGELLVNGYDIGEYIYVENDTGVTLVVSNLSYTGEVQLPTTFAGIPVTEIGEYAFKYQSFTNASVTVGEHVTTIGAYAFNELSGIVSVDLQNTEVLGNYAFAACTNLAVLNSAKVVTLGQRAFNGCTSLVTVILPEAETLGTYAFYGCTSLQKVYFENLTTFGTGNTSNTNCFTNCSALTEFIINKDITSTADLPKGKPSISNTAGCVIYVPLIYIDYYGGEGGKWNSCTVATLDDVFTDSDGNRYVISILSAGCNVEHFLASSALTALTIPDTMTVDGVTYTVVGIEGGAFKSVETTLTSITLPAGMYEFASGCLSELPLLTNISVAAGNRYYSADESGVLFSADGGMLVKYPSGKADAAYTVPSTVLAVGEYAFAGCGALTGITFGENLFVIDSTAFAGTALASVSFTGTTPPVLMGTDIFDTAVSGFTVTVPDGCEETYVRAMNFAEYAPFINSGTDIPQDGAMNLLSQSVSEGSAEYQALPPENAVLPSEDEDDDEGGDGDDGDGDGNDADSTADSEPAAAETAEPETEDSL